MYSFSERNVSAHSLNGNTILKSLQDPGFAWMMELLVNGIGKELDYLKAHFVFIAILD